MSLVKQLTEIEERIQSIYMQRSAVVFGAVMKNGQGNSVNVTAGIDDGRGRLIEVDIGGVPQSNFRVQLNTIAIQNGGGNLSGYFSDGNSAGSMNVTITVDTTQQKWSFDCGNCGVLTASYSILEYTPRANWRVYFFHSSGGYVESVSIYVNGHDRLLFHR
jgi:hypothetical protein